MGCMHFLQCLMKIMRVTNERSQSYMSNNHTVHGESSLCITHPAPTVKSGTKVLKTNTPHAGLRWEHGIASGVTPTELHSKHRARQAWCTLLTTGMVNWELPKSAASAGRMSTGSMPALSANDSVPEQTRSSSNGLPLPPSSTSTVPAYFCSAHL